MIYIICTYKQKIKYMYIVALNTCITLWSLWMSSYLTNIQLFLKTDGCNAGFYQVMNLCLIEAALDHTAKVWKTFSHYFAVPTMHIVASYCLSLALFLPCHLWPHQNRQQLGTTLLQDKEIAWEQGIDIGKERREMDKNIQF